jgi:hypothetical protein
MSKSNLLRTNYTGRGRWAEIARIINQIHRLLNNITFNGNDAIVTTEGIRLQTSTTKTVFSGAHYYAGNYYELTGDAEYAWRHNRSTGKSEWWDKPIPQQWGPDWIYRRTADCREIEYL